MQSLLLHLVAVVADIVVLSLFVPVAIFLGFSLSHVSVSTCDSSRCGDIFAFSLSLLVDLLPWATFLLLALRAFPDQGF